MAQKKTPFFPAHQDFGAQMGERLGFDVPMAFAGHEQEHLAVRKTGGIFDIFGQMVIEVAGKEAAAFLDSIVVADITNLAVQRVVYCSILNSAGGMLDDLTVYHISTERFWVVPSIHRYSAVASILRERRSTFDMTICELGFRFATLSIQGPKSRELVASLTEAPIGADALPYFGVIVTQVAAALGVVLSRTGFTGELGYELFIPSEYADDVYRKAVAAGRDLGVVPCGLMAMGSLRIEKKLLVYGVDMDDTVSPLEAGLGWTIPQKTVDYIGKHAVERQTVEGVQRRLVALSSAPDHTIEPGSPILLNGEVIGKVTSSAVAFTLKKRASIALVSVGATLEGKTVTVRSSAGEVAAIVSLRPLYDPTNLRARG